MSASSESVHIIEQVRSMPELPSEFKGEPELFGMMVAVLGSDMSVLDRLHHSHLKEICRKLRLPCGSSAENRIRIRGLLLDGVAPEDVSMLPAAGDRKRRDENGDIDPDARDDQDDDLPRDSNHRNVPSAVVDQLASSFSASQVAVLQRLFQSSGRTRGPPGDVGLPLGDVAGLAGLLPNVPRSGVVTIGLLRTLL